VADDFGVPPEKLRQWNHLRGNQLTQGRVILIHPVAMEAEAQPTSRTSPVAAKSRSSNYLKPPQRRVHKVKPGETLASIAADYKTTVGQLQRSNKLASATIHPGDLLVISEPR